MPRRERMNEATRRLAPLSRQGAAKRIEALMAYCSLSAAERSDAVNRQTMEMT